MYEYPKYEQPPKNSFTNAPLLASHSLIRFGESNCSATQRCPFLSSEMPPGSNTPLGL